MNFLMINSGDTDPFVAFSGGGKLSVSHASDFIEDNEAGNKKPDKLIHCLNKIANGNDLNSINTISVTTGPGSFTGIRVGISIAKGLGFGLGKKIISINNFLLCLNRLPEIDAEKKYCVLIPAKLPEFYYSIIENNVITASGCVNPENFALINEKDTPVVGDFDNESLIKHYYFEYTNVKNLKSELNSMLELTELQFDLAKEAAEIEPLYLKDFSIKKTSGN